MFESYQPRLTMPEISQNRTEVEAPIAVERYIRIVLFALEERGPCVTLRIPSLYVTAVFDGVRQTVPEVRTYMLEWYRGHARILVWRVPERRVGEVEVEVEHDQL